MRRFLKINIILLCGLLFLSCCQNSFPTGTMVSYITSNPTASSSLTSKATVQGNLNKTLTVTSSSTQRSPIQTLTPSHSVTEASTSTQFPLRKLADFADGEYIIFRVNSSLGLVSLDGTSIGLILDISHFLITFSTDYHFAILGPDTNGEFRYLVNMNSFEKTPLTFLKDCFAITPSSTAEFLLGSCNYENSDDLYVFTSNEGKKVRLTYCHDEYANCMTPAFSPDGKWISYLRQTAGAGQTKKNGIYFMKANCITAPNTCPYNTFGPYSIGSNYLWSPNSKYLLGLAPDTISVFEFTGGSIKLVNNISGIEMSFLTENLAWSLDSKKLAFTNGKNIQIMESDGTNQNIVKKFDQEVYVLGWIHIRSSKIFSP